MHGGEGKRAPYISCNYLPKWVLLHTHNIHTHTRVHTLTFLCNIIESCTTFSAMGCVVVGYCA